MGADLVHGVLRGVVIAVVGAVVEVDDVDRGHAALDEGEVIVFDRLFGLEEVALVAEFLCGLGDQATSQPVEWVSCWMSRSLSPIMSARMKALIG